MQSITACAILAFLPLSVPVSPENELVVHEWGTFTSFAGPDGSPRVFQTSVGAALPGFVYSRALQAGHEDDHELNRVKFLHDTLVRMETPVTYFYTSVPRTVDVDVRMPHGALTEFYPPVTRMEPLYQSVHNEVASGGRLVWKGLGLIPATKGMPVDLPPVADGDHYGAARDVDAAFVHFEGLGGVHHERFLFYRGIGNFDPPVIVSSAGGDRFVVRNRQAEAAPAVFVLDVAAGRLRYAKHGRCATELTVALPRESASVDPLATAMEGALVDAGLYAKEAAAMVATWKSSWFAEEGTRVLYILPQEVTDRLVPLRVTPSPGAQVRVFVGRAEVMTREAQARVEQELARIEDPREGWSAPIIKELGRFAVPVIECIQESPLDAEAGRVARRMLGK